MLITLAYSALGSRRAGRHCVLMLLVLFPFLLYTSIYPKVLLYPKVFLIGIKDFSEALKKKKKKKANVLNFDEAQFVIFSSMGHVFSHDKKSLPIPKLQRFSSIFFL